MIALLFISCGPFLEYAVERWPHRPDAPFEPFARGEIGIPHATWQPSFLVHAYRVMSGTPTSKEQQAALVDAWTGLFEDPAHGSDGANAWRNARQARVSDTPPPVEQFVVSDYGTVLNIHDDALLNAAKKLNGFKWPETLISAWVHTQDQVFGDCAKTFQPHVVTTGDKEFLAEFDYQTGARAFYCGDYATARQAFASNPYLLARVELRAKAYDKAIAILRKLPKTPAVERLLGFARFRADPKGYACDAMATSIDAKASSAVGFASADLSRMEQPETCGGKAKDVAQWITVLKKADKTAALARYRETKSVPWLFAALATGDRSGDLIAAVDSLPTDHPAALALRAHTGSRALVAALDARMQKAPLGMINEYRAARAALAESPGEMGLFLPRYIAGVSSMSFELDRNQPQRGLVFGEDVVALGPKLSLEVLLAVGKTLPAGYLQRTAYWSAFTRAVILEKDAQLIEVSRLLAVLEPAAKGELEAIIAKPTPDDRRAEAFVLLTGLPALAPTLFPGFDRQAAKLHEDLSYFRNWWCAPDAKLDGDAEWKAIVAAGDGLTFMASTAIAWAKAHPDDPRSPKALARVAHASKRACGGQGNPQAKAAFRLLQTSFGKTDWAKKTKYVY